MNPILAAAVERLVRTVAAEIVLPRYRALAAHESEEKTPGDLVTIADREAEAALEAGLAALLPGARFVGEERCVREPELLDALGEGPVWVVDPIDGTGNFAAGRPPFAIMVALLRDGATVASWIHDPLAGRMAVARRGDGATFDGVPVVTGSAPADDAALRGIVSGFAMPGAMAAPVARLAAAVAETFATARCAGHEYPRVASGDVDFALFWRTLVWDHAAGALLLAEAGGVVERLDGSSYVPGSTESGLLLARDRATADRVRALLA